jgi:nucleotide-binding universal stress UspA family protein
MAKAVRMMPDAQATVLVVRQDFDGAPEDVVRMFEADTEDEVFPTAASAREVFQEMRRRIGAIAPKARYKVAKGNVRKEILAEAANHDLLVMHATSRGGVLARGSHRLARKAPCDVLLVRPTPS